MTEQKEKILKRMGKELDKMGNINIYGSMTTTEKLQAQKKLNEVYSRLFDLKIYMERVFEDE
jgi:hypothetical protein